MIKFQKPCKGRKDRNILNQKDVKLRCPIIVGSLSPKGSIIVIILEEDLGNGRCGPPKDELHGKFLTLEENSSSFGVIIFETFFSATTKTQTSNGYRRRQMISMFG
jgi:hypothetical protein